MQKRKIYRKILIYLLLINLVTLLFFLYRNLDSKLPDEIKILVGTDGKFNFNIPLEANIQTEDVGVISVNNSKIPSNQININLNRPFTLQSSQTGEYKVYIKLFGFLKFKQISLDVIDSVELIPYGGPIGIYVETDGILVLGSGKITGMDGLNYEPVSNKLKSGDYIVKLNGSRIINKKDLISEIQKGDGKDITLIVRRNNEEISVRISPIKTASGEYKIGAWIRDDTQGIGTLTFLTSTGRFGALGHGITDIDTGLLMEIKNGSIYSAEILSIIKGKEGEPGELVGMIKQSDKDKIGNITENTYQGIYGYINTTYYNLLELEPMNIGLKQEVRKGSASIRCFVEDQIMDYQIEIQEVDMSNNNHSKGMVIKITDERLLNITGGIVQGMSGSPIIQNNKIIGAVTHVFIQDSSKGYGTFIENMVNNLE